jgi:osmoprotectant transport system permease protein
MRPGEPLVRWDWIAANLGEIGERTWDHVLMTLIAVTAGFALSAVLSLLVLRWRGLYSPLLAVSGILYTIPSLALFALLVPVTGLSLLTAEIALTSYTLLILLRNTISGLDGVPAEVVEAANGMGYGRWQRLWRVELPLATPAIVAGLRIATVSTIGLVAISALIGQTNLGSLIIRSGIRDSFPTAILVGAAGSVLLAVVADLAFVGAQRHLTPWEQDGAPDRWN